MVLLLRLQISQFYEKFYANKGVSIMKNSAVSGFEGSGKVSRLQVALASTYWVGALHAAPVPLAAVSK